MAVDIDSLQIEIEATSSNAAAKVDALASSLTNLRSAAKGGVGLSTVSKQLQALSSAADVLNSTNLNSSKIKELSSALNSLANIQKASGLASTINALKKLPEISSALEKTDLGKFATQLKQVTSAIGPLAAEMQKVSNGFSAFPIRIQKIIQSNAGLSASNQTAGKSFGFLGTGISSAKAKFGIYLVALRQIASEMSEWVKSSNDYVENLNLFTVAMGDSAQEAYDFAYAVKEAYGIDPSEWMRNQGVFMQMEHGFGVASENAALMSKNLTQLGYDISSFYNISIEDAMLKLQSGMAGEIEPLRRLGYAIDVATLQQVAYNHGIDASVDSMNQAQKSQLRYIAIMEQSGNAMGDLGRTIQTPANALRIFQQQVTQLQRALGNLLIPVLQSVLPYFQAFVIVVTDAVQALAELFGFELPQIDYSGIGDSLGSASVGAGDLAGGLSDAADAAKKLKQYTIGIDELNILSPDTGSSSGGGSSGGGIASGGDLGLDLPEYDFLNGALESRVKDIVEQIKNGFSEVLDIILAIGAGIAAWKISNTVLNFFKKLFPGALKDLNTFKKSLGLALMVTGFSLEFSGFKEIGAGQADFLSYIKAGLGAALGIGGSLLVFGTGPLGWTVGLTLSLFIGVIGYVQGQEELQEQLTLDTFFDEQGVAIDVYVEKVNTIAAAFTNGVQPILDWSDAVESGREKILSTWGEIDVLMTKMNYASETISQEDIEQLKTAFSTLHTTVMENLNNTTSIIITSLNSVFDESASGVTASVDVMVGEVLRLKDEIGGKATEINNELQTKLDELAQYDPGSTQYAAIMDEIDQLAISYGNLTGEVDISTTKWTDAVRQFNENKIDFQDPQKAQEALSQMETAASDAVTALEDSRLAALNAVDTLEKQASSLGDYDATLFEDLRDSINENYASQKGEIETQFKSIATDIGNSFTTQFEAALNTNLENSTWGDHAAATLLAPFSDALYMIAVADTKEGLNGVINGLNEFGWAAGMDTMNGYGNDIVDSFATGMLDERSQAIDAAKDVIEGPLGLIPSTKRMLNVISDESKVYKDFGKNIDEGLKNGISTNSSIVNTAIEGVLNGLRERSATLLDSHSPSRVYEDFGHDIDQGLANGINNNASPVTSAMDNLLNALISKMETFSNRCRTALNSLLSDFSSSMSSVQVSSSGSVSYRGMSSVYIPRFANGGYPETGQLFYANEDGPEMIGRIGTKTAVANNDQITVAIASAVYEAVMAAMAQQQDRPIQANMEVLLDGKTIYKRNEQIRHEQGYQLSNNPNLF